MRLKNLLFVKLIILLLVSSSVEIYSQQTTKISKGNMERKVINPWTWQDRCGFVQANEISGGKRILFTAGQVSVDKDGNLLYPGDMEKQINKVVDNLETVLEQADFKLSDVVKITYYTTDVQAFSEMNLKKKILMNRLKKAGCKPATSLIGVSALFHPECVVEIEAVAMD